MRICYIIRNLNPVDGGTERVTSIVSKGLQEYRYDTYYLYSNNDWDAIPDDHKLFFKEKASAQDLFALFRSFLVSHNINKLIIINQLHQNKKYQHVYSRLKDVINDLKIISCLHASPDKWINKNEFKYTWNKIYFKDLIKSIIYTVYNPSVIRAKGMYDISDKIVLLSASYKDVYCDVYKIKDSDNKLIAISNPCPFDDIYTQSRKDNTLIVVGRMDEAQKRISLILKIWQLIHRSTSWKLKIIGDGPDLPRYKSIAKEYNLSNIEFVGHSSNVSEYYKDAKIFLMTSIWEGLPMTLLEAHHYGCIPFAFDTFASLHELIEDGKTGYIIKNNELEEYAKKVLDLIQDNHLQKVMCDEITSRYHLRFNVNEIIPIWNNLLNQL